MPGGTGCPPAILTCFKQAVVESPTPIYLSNYVCWRTVSSNIKDYLDAGEKMPEILLATEMEAWSPALLPGDH